MEERIATVIKNAGSHYLLSELPRWEPFPAVLRGKVRLQKSSATNPIAVGDRVSYITADEKGPLLRRCFATLYGEMLHRGHSVRCNY